MTSEHGCLAVVGKSWGPIPWQGTTDVRRQTERIGTMKSYSVVWTMDIIASTPQDAAERALLIQRDPESIATCFEVTPQGVDLGRGAPAIGETVQVDLTYPEPES